VDPHCDKARETIRRLCGVPEADVHFLVGGTQTNLVVIDALLRPYEAVIAAQTAHVNVHETGAIEATGHKVCTAFSLDGKLTPELVENVVNGHSTEHMVLPRLVYISDTTELGTVYTKAELAALRRCCDEHGLYLYLDGARLGSALTSPGNDVTLPDLVSLTDAFTIGGTKNGALFGEAVVLKAPDEHFRYYMKRRGAVLAKGRLLGVQFQALLEDGLYFDLARHANDMAFRLRDGVAALGYPFPVESPSNQQFPVLPNDVVDRLRAMGYEFETDRVVDEAHTSVRFVTSWATTESAVDAFLKDLAAV
jgi:threonine aldolase